MNRSATRPFRRPLTAIGLALALLAGLYAAPAGATPFPNGYRFAQSVQLAGANWTTLDDGLFEDLTIVVVDGAETSGERPGMTRYEPAIDVVYDRWETSDAGVTTHLTYRTIEPVEPAAFAFDPAMRRASVDVEVTLRGGTICTYPGSDPPDGRHPASDFDEEEDDCTQLPAVPARVSLQWTGTGDIHRGNVRFRETFDAQGRFFLHELTTSRDADVAGGVRLLAPAPAELTLPERPADVGVLVRGRVREQLVLPR
ncbi:hypothetical protein [Egicoccus sp. AB-alg2]|uniref:hypothetical protein n=1 Tax=Egicoccus sp. AB-alg2 TaxID=3242693 RepID=UPI00359ED524